MNASLRRTLPYVSLCVTVLWVTVHWAASSASAYTPQSPKVKQLISKALVYLRSNEALNGNHMQRLGAKALHGLAVYKATKNANDPVVQRAVAACRRVAAMEISQIQKIENSNYSLGIATIFMATVGPQRYKAEIQQLANALMDNQMQGGGWCYLFGGEGAGVRGDTSQTQYGVLGCWMAQKAGAQVPDEVFERAMGWLMRTQDPGGGFAYTPKDPGGGQRVQQNDRITISLTAAGAGSLLICGDALNMWDDGDKKKRQDPRGDVPPALREIKAKGAKRAGPKTSIPKANVLGTAGLAHKFFTSRFSWGAQQFYYFIYAMERYMSFKEFVEGSEDEEPAWYNKGVDVLAERQKQQGYWDGENGKTVSTSFAVLFLLRSMKTEIGTAVQNKGLLVGGKGLPKDVSTLREGKDGKVEGKKIKGELDDLLAIVAAADNTDYDALVEQIPDIKLPKKDTKKRDKQMELLKKRISHPNYAVRVVAVKTLARTGSLDVVPAMLYALTDPDLRVCLEARDGLRFISRKFGGFGMPNKPNEEQKKLAQKAWTDWYFSVRPNGKLIID